jgi:transposase
MKMGRDWVLMSVKEASRLEVFRRLEKGELSQAQASQQLGVGVRQVKRLARRWREQGASGLVSRRRGAPSNRCIASAVRQRMLDLVRAHYADFGPELAREYLAREHGFVHSTETLRGWMIQAGLWVPKPRRTKRVHSPRLRRACLGELVQIDASHHDWFEGRAAKCCLIASIDDATGHVLGARFAPTETTQGYLGVLRRYVATHGAPLALYSDRHAIFTKSDSEDPVPTQFERALLQLGIEPICARTPQAKGRVERLFQTLQDRMVKAMRLGRITGIEQANAWLCGYLHQHNERFGVAARERTDMHRPWPSSPEQLAHICALHHQRQLSAQHSCRFEGQILQLDAGQPQAPKASAMVDIAQHRDGRLELSYRGHGLTHRSFACHDHMSRDKVCDSKGLDERINRLHNNERERIARLAASIEHQDNQRAKGIYGPDSPANAPRVAERRYGLRPSQPSATRP